MDSSKPSVQADATNTSRGRRARAGRRTGSRRPDFLRSIPPPPRGPFRALIDVLASNDDPEPEDLELLAFLEAVRAELEAEALT